MGFWSFLLSILALLSLNTAESVTVSETYIETKPVLSEPYEEPAAEPAAPEAQQISQSDAAVDAERFYADCGELSRLAAGSDAAAVLALYDALYEAFLTADTQSVYDYLDYCRDVLDGELLERQIASESLRGELGTALCQACRSVMDGPCAGAFRLHVGDTAADYFAAYESTGERGRELLDREAELEAGYYELIADSADWSYAYDGRDWTLDLLVGSGGDRLYDEDPDAYFEVYN